MLRWAVGAVAAITMFSAAPAVASHDAQGAERAAMLQALGAPDDPDCWETIVADADTSWGLGYQYSDQGCGGSDTGPHFILQNTGGGWAQRVLVADKDYDRNNGQCPFAGVPTPVAVDFALCERPKPCGRAAARYLEDYLWIYGQAVFPRYYRLYTDEYWTVYKPRCINLAGDSRPELLFQLLGGTGGAVTPWAIYGRDALGRWALEYGQMRNTVYGLTVRHRTVKAHDVYRYEGAGTHILQDRTVRWSHGRFRSHLGRPYDVCKRRRCYG